MRRFAPFLLAFMLLLPAAAAFADDSTYQTPNGPETLASMTVGLQAAGYNGPWDNASVIAAYIRTSTPSPVVQQQSPTIATSAPSAVLMRCRAYCFMVPDGRGQGALTSLASLAGGSINFFTLIGAEKAISSGDFYRMAYGTTIQVDTPNADYMPHITVLDGGHQGATGHTIWEMLAAL